MYQVSGGGTKLDISVASELYWAALGWTLELRGQCNFQGSWACPRGPVIDRVWSRGSKLDIPGKADLVNVGQ